MINKEISIYRVLLVEDNPPDTFLVQNLSQDIDTFSMDIKHVDTLEMALHQLQHQSFDIILLDLSLPDCGGVKGIQTLIKQSPNTPIVVLTSNINPDLPSRAIESGAQDYLLKDELNSHALSKSVRYALDRNYFQQRTLEQERKQAALELQIANTRLLNQLASDITHEFRTPLTIIMSVLDTIRLNPSPEVIEKKVERIQYGIRQLVAIGDYMSMITRLASLNRDEADVLRTVDIQSICSTFQTKSTRVVYAIEPDISIQINPEDFRILLWSIIHNGLLYSEESSPVHVSARVQETRVIITVQDHGIGIAPEDQEKIFYPFLKVSESRTRLGEDSAGIGLSAVKAIATAYGGTITVDSEVNVGSTFTITLPLTV